MSGRRWALIGLATAGLLALAAGLAWRQFDSGDTSGSDAKRDGATLLALALPDAAGKDQSVEQWKGKVLVVNFWATWCEPCREEMPRFIELQDQYGERGLQFVGVAVDQAEKVRQFADEIHLNYPTLMGGYGAIELSKTLGNRFGALPFTVVVDRGGTIVYTQLGPVNDTQFRSMIGQLI